MTHRHLRTPPRALEQHESSHFDFDAPDDYQTIEVNGDASRDYKAVDQEYLNQEGQPKIKQDSADWDTRATILLAEAIVVTIIVGTIIICCMRKQQRRVSQQPRVFITREQIQEWATIRVPPTSSGPVVLAASSPGGVRSRTRVDSNMSGMISVHSGIGGMVAVGVGPDGRIRVDSGNLGSMGLAAASAHPPSVANNEAQVAPETGNQGNRTVGHTIMSIPRSIANVLMYPLRMLEAGVNDWAQENQDEVFLRQFMERYEAEREAAQENPQDREVRLKEAFMKECMIWELGEENFIPPKELFALGGNNDQVDDLGKPIKCIDYNDDDPIMPDPEDINHTLYSLGEVKPGGAHESEEGKIDIKDHQKCGEIKCKIDREGQESNTDDCVQRDCQQSGENQEPSTGVPIQVEAGGALDNGTVAVSATDCIDIDDSSVKSGNTSSSDSQETPNGPGAVKEQTEIEIMMDGPANSADNRPRTSSAPALSTIDMNEDTFDTDSTPGYLYLNTTGQNRRRANTSGSNGTSDVSSANQSRLSSAESMESISSSAAASSTSQDSYKIRNECAICLCEYEKGDVVVTSCNSECPHAFHQECIVEWLVKMQEGAPCPCCRRTFVELDEYIPHNLSGSGHTARNNSNTAAVNSNNDATTTVQQQVDPEEMQRQREERRRRRIEQGIQRGSHAFNPSVISMRSSSRNNNISPEEAERLRQERLERNRRNFELGMRRGGRAFNTSVISMR